MSWDVPGSVRVWVGVGFGLWLGVGGLGRPRTFDGNPGHPSRNERILFSSNFSITHNFKGIMAD